MKKSERKIVVVEAEQIGRDKWLEMRKDLGLRPASLYQTMGPHWCNLWELRFKDGRKQFFAQY